MRPIPACGKANTEFWHRKQRALHAQPTSACGITPSRVHDRHETRIHVRLNRLRATF